MKYSFIVPVYDEAESLRELHGKITNIAKKLGSEYEVIYIDDGSKDDSFFELQKIFQEDSAVKILRFRSNSGKSAALNEGFTQAKGEVIITLDADLQDEPEEIIKMKEKLDEGFDLVSSWKQNRHDPISKTIPSKLFNLTVQFFSGIKLHDFNSGLKIYRRDIVKQLNLYGELHRFIPVIAANSGFLITEVPVVHHERKYGHSKYGWSRMPKGFLDFLTVMFLTKFEFSPLHFFGAIGSILCLFGFISGTYLTILRLLGETIGDRPLLILTMLLISAGLQFIFSGLLAEMILHLSPRKSFPIKTLMEHEDK